MASFHCAASAVTVKVLTAHPSRAESLWSNSMATNVGSCCVIYRWLMRNCSVDNTILYMNTFLRPLRESTRLTGTFWKRESENCGCRAWRKMFTPASWATWDPPGTSSGLKGVPNAWRTGGRSWCRCLTGPMDPSGNSSRARGSCPKAVSMSCSTSGMVLPKSPTMYKVAFAGKYHRLWNALRCSTCEISTLFELPMGKRCPSLFSAWRLCRSWQSTLYSIVFII
mmetsp:Transcript_39203/g.47469  ORF Transcript_39203/g.47469 Transcript_39203/m.47469 type:complete len:225 (-) Transcript_39203:442-1116(-)